MDVSVVFIGIKIGSNKIMAKADKVNNRINFKKDVSLLIPKVTTVIRTSRESNNNKNFEDAMDQLTLSIRQIQFIYRDISFDDKHLDDINKIIINIPKNWNNDPNNKVGHVVETLKKLDTLLME